MKLDVKELWGKPLAANVYGLRIVFLQKSQLQTGKPESWAKSPFRLIFRILMYWMLFDRRKRT